MAQAKPQQQKPEFDAYKQLLPSDESSERVVICTSLRFAHRMRECMAILRPEHFILDKHRFVWGIMHELNEAEEPVTFNSLVTGITKIQNGWDSAGGFGYVADFQDSLDSPDVDSNLWIRSIVETYARRRLMYKCNESLIKLADRSESPADISQELEEEARNCAAIGEPSSGFSTFADTVRRCGGMNAFLERGAGDAIPYPWQSLNQITNGGMRPGQVIVIAGPSGMGKTTLALNICHRAARSEAGAPVVFSLEMGCEEIQAKLLSLAARVDGYQFRALHESQRQLIRDGAKYLAENKIWVYDDDNISIPAMRATVKKLMSVEPISMVMVDYIQLVEGGSSRGETREQEVSKVMRGLKRMARQLKVPIVALSQILEDAGAGTREPELKDLRESRSIGHTANLVAFLHFTRRYDIAHGVPTGELDLLVRKQRSGPEGRFTMKFHAPTGRFYEETER